MDDRISISTGFPDEFLGSAKSKVLKDFYLIGLWSYCEGQKTGGVEGITYCSSPKFQFWFDPTNVWGLRNTILKNGLGEKLHGRLHRYSKVMGWMNCAFVFAVVLIAAELVWCLLCFSRTGSLVVWILCIVRVPRHFRLCLLVLTSSRPRRSSLSQLPQPRLRRMLCSKVYSTRCSGHTRSILPWVKKCL